MYLTTYCLKKTEHKDGKLLKRLQAYIMVNYQLAILNASLCQCDLKIPKPLIYHGVVYHYTYDPIDLIRTLGSNMQSPGTGSKLPPTSLASRHHCTSGVARAHLQLEQVGTS